MTKEQLNAAQRARTLFAIGYFSIYMVSQNLVLTCTPVPILMVCTMIVSLVMFLRSMAIKDRLHQEYDEQTNQETRHLSTATGWYIPDNWQSLDEPGVEPPVPPSKQQLRQLSDAMGCEVQIAPSDQPVADDQYEPVPPLGPADEDGRYCAWNLTLSEPQPFGRTVTTDGVVAVVEPYEHHNPDTGDTEGEW